jgi:hypothetical protein
MPEISRFYGIVIRMYYDDHPPPHFHAHYGEDEALINIHTMAIVAGQLPPRAFGDGDGVGCFAPGCAQDGMGKSTEPGAVRQYCASGVARHAL